MTMKIQDRAGSTLLSITFLASVGAGVCACSDQTRIVLDNVQPLQQFSPPTPARQIAVDSNSLYWLSWEVVPPPGWQGDEPSLLVMTKANKDGSNPTALATTGFTFDNALSDALYVDGIDGFFSDQQFIKSAPTSVGDPTVLTAGADPIEGIAMDDTNIYWTQGSFVDDTTGGVWKVSKAGGQPVQLASSQTNPGSIAVDGTSVYWIAGPVDGPSLLTASTSGGTPTALAPAASGSSLVLDDHDVYFDVDGLVRRVAKAGGPSTVLMNNISPTTRMLADADNVYVTSDAATIVKLSKADLSVTTLAQQDDGDPIITCMAVDDTTVFWSNSDGTIHSVAK